MLFFELLDPRMTADHLGLIPSFLSVNDPDPAWKQIDKHYQHGGGWSSFEGFTLLEDNTIVFEGDPPLHPLAQAKLRDELIVFYEFAWVAIIQPDRSFNVARID